MITWKSEKTSVSYCKASKKILKILNKCTKYIPCLPAVFNLIEGSNVKEMEAKIEDYKRNNAESIITNEAKKV